METLLAICLPGTRLQMRCYFHLVSTRETILDDMGVDVPDLEAAKGEAVKAVRELHQENGGTNEGWSGWSLNIVGPDGTLLYSIDLDTCDLSTRLH
jgi:hypothetical protein